MTYATANGATAIFLFIAELLGAKNLTPEDKCSFGVDAWVNTITHSIDLTTDDGRKELHETIWLERLYTDLDGFYMASCPDTRRLAHHIDDHATEYTWTVPIELDASASMLSYIGLLLGDERLLTMTNTHYVPGATLNDPWACDGIPRSMFKTAATPMLYGSGKSAAELWADLPFTTAQLEAYSRELSTGALGIANDLKDFVTGYVKPKERMQITVYNDTFEVECNRHHNVGEEMKLYDIYDSTTDSIQRIAHMETSKVADLDGFKRWFQTGLIHSLDSQVADIVMEKLMSKYGWGLDIHDAFIVNPESAMDVRVWYAEELDIIYQNRKEILQAYFRSIGIGAEAKPEWDKLVDKVHSITDFKASIWALK
jgi:hypothetical protein